MALIQFLVALVSVFLGILQMLMLIRAILSWLPFDDSSPLVQFVTIATEPIIIPVRILMEKLNLFSDLPIDLSFLVAYMLLIFVRFLLPAVHF